MTNKRKSWTAVCVASALLAMLFWIYVRQGNSAAGLNGGATSHGQPTAMATDSDEQVTETGGPPPTQAMMLFNEALTNNDAELYAKNHLRGTPEEEEYAEGVKSVLVAQRRMIAAFKEKLDPNDISTLPEGSFYMVPLSEPQLRGMRVTWIDERTADIAVPGLLTYRAVLVDGQWHVQITPTIASRYPSDPGKAIHVLTNMFNELAGAFDQTSGEILQGRLTSQGDIYQAISGRVKKVVATYSGSLPPEGHG